jgi:predicted CXXCH cytochrome family protein
MPFGRTIELRLTDDGAPIDGAVVGVIRTMARPALTLSPGQRRGVDVAGPVDDQDLEPPVPTPAPAAPRDATAEIRDDVDYALVPPAAIVDARTALATSVPQYRLAVAQPSDTDAPGPLGAPFDSPHVPDSSLVADTCARCHSGHVGQGPMLLPDPNPQASLCMSCHDGTSGSVIDIAGQYAGAPTNDATTRSYYRHDALAPSVHTLDGDDEFGGVLERHSECGDCHNPHRAVDTDAIQMTTGWTVSGRQEGLSGVSIGNGAVGTPPTYTFLDGTPGSQPTREYEICLKCHSGFTVLPSNEGQPPSRYALDKGIDLNPDNASYHPIAAPGKNGTTTMANSLGGTSPYKLWDFTTGSTVRCVNCHGDPAKATVADPPTPGGALAPHASENRGLLLQPYRDRTLKIAGEPYDAAEFALCYVCHAEAPFLNIGTGMTSFDLHALHLSDLPGGSGGLDIDTPGAGQGYATCAECHFRLHSTAGAVNAGDRDNSRLVNFAPNVQPTSGGVLEWTKVGAGGTCTLTCHGAPHNGFDY